jgi:hypothetical protein
MFVWAQCVGETKDIGCGSSTDLCTWDEYISESKDVESDSSSDPYVLGLSA